MYVFLKVVDYLYYEEDIIAMEKKFVTLKHLLIEEKKCIGLQFYTDRVINALVNELPGIRWSDVFNMYYVINNPSNLNMIYKQLKGVAWVNSNYFFPKSS